MRKDIKLTLSKANQITAKIFIHRHGIYPMQEMVFAPKKPVSQQYLDSARSQRKINVEEAIKKYTRAVDSAFYEKDSKMALNIMAEAYPLITRRAHEIGEQNLNKTKSYYALAAEYAEYFGKFGEHVGYDQSAKEKYEQESKEYYRAAAYATSRCASACYKESRSINDPAFRRKRESAAIRLWKKAAKYAKKSESDCTRLLSDIQTSCKMALLLRDGERIEEPKGQTSKIARISDIEERAKELFDKQFYRTAIDKYKEAATLSQELGYGSKSALLLKTAAACAVSAAETFCAMSRYDIASEYLITARNIAIQINDTEFLKDIETRLKSTCDIGLSLATLNVSKYSNTEMQSTAALEAEKALNMLETLHQYKRIDNYDSKFKELSYSAAAATARAAFEDFYKDKLENAAKGFETAERHATNSGNQKLVNEIHKIQKIIRERSMK